MGYEVKIYVGEKSDSTNEDGARYFSVIGMIDVCKPGYSSRTYKLCADESADDRYPRIYFYKGADPCSADPYEKELRAIPIQLAIDAIEYDEHDSQYRRFQLALDFLKSVQKNFAASKSLGVVMYGY